jgi:hypothetical protein
VVAPESRVSLERKDVAEDGLLEFTRAVSGGLEPGELSPDRGGDYFSDSNQKKTQNTIDAMTDRLPHKTLTG